MPEPEIERLSVAAQSEQQVLRGPRVQPAEIAALSQGSSKRHSQPAVAPMPCGPMVGLAPCKGQPVELAGTRIARACRVLCHCPICLHNMAQGRPRFLEAPRAVRPPCRAPGHCLAWLSGQPLQKRGWHFLVQLPRAPRLGMQVLQGCLHGQKCRGGTLQIMALAQPAAALPTAPLGSVTPRRLPP